MNYRKDYAKAALRHLAAAEFLNHKSPQGRRDIAGYLYGIAAECALKEMMRRHGIPVDKDSGFYEHFPNIKRAILHDARSRGNAQLHRYASDGKLMREWDVKMRYAPEADVLGKPIDEWAESARKLKNDMEAL